MFDLFLLFGEEMGGGGGGNRPRSHMGDISWWKIVSKEDMM